MRMNRKKTMIWAVLDILLLAVAVLEIYVLMGKAPDSEEAKQKNEYVSENSAEGGTGTLIETPAPDAVVFSAEPVEAEGNESETGADANAEAIEDGVSQKGEIGLKISEIIENSEGTWEAYIADENGNILSQQDSEEDMRAGDIEYFFMAEQIYAQARAGEVDTAQVDTADALLESPDGEDYSNLMDLLYDFVVDWDSERKQFDLLQQEYPNTFWAAEDWIGYTCAQDGANLLENIVANAGKGDPYAADEENYIKKGWSGGKIAAALEAKEAEVFEVMSENREDSRMEAFACVLLPGNTRYVIGIMAKDLTDFAAAKETIGEIAALTYEYYTNSGV